MKYKGVSPMTEKVNWDGEGTLSSLAKVFQPSINSVSVLAHELQGSKTIKFYSGWRPSEDMTLTISKEAEEIFRRSFL